MNTTIRTNENGRPLPPENVDIEENTYAVAIHQEGQTFFRYEQSSPLRSEPEWHERDHFNHDEVPRMNLRNAVIDYEPSNGGLSVVWIFTDKLQAEDETSVSREVSKSEPNPQDHVIKFDDGTQFGDRHQYEVMRKAVNHLIEEYDLIDKITTPYMAGYKNALINDEPRHPDGQSKKEGPNDWLKLSNEKCYLYTHMSGDQKKKKLSELAEKCEIDMATSGQW